LTSYAHGLIDLRFSRIPPLNNDDRSLPPYQGSVAEHIQLLHIGRDVLGKLTEDNRIISAAVPTLFHPDLHKRNIFVSEDDPTIVTNIIDWQSSSIEPALYYADESPDFATARCCDDNATDANLANICAQAFDACMKGVVPKLSTARDLDPILLRVFRYCSRTWQDGAAAFRHELIDLVKHWSTLKLPQPCPYHVPEAKEMQKHEKQFELFQEKPKLKQHLVELLETTGDGWVPQEAWQSTREAHLAVFKRACNDIKEAKDLSLDVETFVSMWPFDILTES
jgi:hypothetical protein